MFLVGFVSVGSVCFPNAELVLAPEPEKKCQSAHAHPVALRGQLCVLLLLGNVFLVVVAVLTDLQFHCRRVQCAGRSAARL